MKWERARVPDAQAMVSICEEERERMRTKLRTDLIGATLVLVRWLFGYRLGDSKRLQRRRMSVRMSRPW